MMKLPQWRLAKSSCSNFFNIEINDRYFKSKQLQFIKWTNWILLSTVRGIPVSTAPTFYLDANKLGMMSYKSGDRSKVIQDP